DRFWLGYGLNSFWLGWEGPSAQIWAVSGWQPGYAHNGYLDLWLSLGIIGLTLGVILLIYLLIYSFYFYIIKRLDTQFWILFLIFVFLLNFSEGTLLRSNSIWWVMIVYFASMIKIRVKPKPELSMGLLDR
ncbi:MAG: O-antigen ligase family protein, partial [Anaerolineales bacterium]